MLYNCPSIYIYIYIYIYIGVILNYNPNIFNFVKLCLVIENFEENVRKRK